MEANIATLKTEVSTLQKNVNFQKCASITTLVMGILGVLAAAIETPFAFLYFESVAVALMAATGLSIAAAYVLMISVMLVPAIVGILAPMVSLIFFIVKKANVKKLDQKKTELIEAEKPEEKETDETKETDDTTKIENTTSDLTDDQKNLLNSRLENIRNLYVKEATRRSTSNQTTKNAMSSLIKNPIDKIDPIFEIIYYKKENSIDIKDLLSNSTIWYPKKVLREDTFQKGTKSITNIHNPENLKIHEDGLFTRLQNNKNTDSNKIKGQRLFDQILEKFQLTEVMRKQLSFYIRDNNWKELMLSLLNEKTKLKQ